MFSKIYLIEVYYQIPIEQSDIPKTAMITPFWLYMFIRIPFGLRNAAQSFQRFIEQITRGPDFCFDYLDDLLVAKKNEEEHVVHLRLLMTRLEENGVIINPDKCQLGVQELIFLGHPLDYLGIKTLPDKVEAIFCFFEAPELSEIEKIPGVQKFVSAFPSYLCYYYPASYRGPVF